MRLYILQTLFKHLLLHLFAVWKLPIIQFLFIPNFITYRLITHDMSLYSNRLYFWITKIHLAYMIIHSILPLSVSYTHGFSFTDSLFLYISLSGIILYCWLSRIKYDNSLLDLYIYSSTFYHNANFHLLSFSYWMQIFNRQGACHASRQVTKILNLYISIYVEGRLLSWKKIYFWGFTKTDF